MKRFQCPNCGNGLYFDSTACVSCGRPVAYDPTTFSMVNLDGDANGGLKAAHEGEAAHRQICANAQHDACNWLAAPDDESGFCLSCRHNRTVPDLSVPENLTGWQALELAKRQMFYSLLRWRLPAPTPAENEEAGLEFDILASTVKPDGTVDHVLTGHESGLITLNIAEADDAIREKTRTEMGEPYRTLLGHLRHEVGHYYFDWLVRAGGKTDAFRKVFGDERADYAEALKRNYEQGPPDDWQLSFISAYASVHPWEDFAETWAHYIHIVDSLETARAYGMTVDAATAGEGEAEVEFRPYDAPNVDAIIDVWVPFTLALNSINRSMGQRDFYPFVINQPVMEKLAFIHDLIHERRS